MARLTGSSAVLLVADIGRSDVEAIHAEFQRRGAPIEHEPEADG